MEEIKHPINDLYVVSIGTKNEIQELTICRKEKDDNNNTYYLDLLTNSKYPTSSDDENEVIALNPTTLASTIIKIKNKNRILENRFITNADLIDLYEYLNMDTEYYEIRETNPSKVITNDQDKGYKYEKEDTLSELIIALKTDPRIKVITGERGIGKTTLMEALTKQIEDKTKTPNTNSPNPIWFLDYEKLKIGALTTKHLENRIQKVFNYTYNSSKAKPTILFIDNIDLNNPNIIKLIQKEAKKLDLSIILISNEEIKKELFAKDSFQIIEAKQPSEKILERIINRFFEKKVVENDPNGFCNRPNFFDDTIRLLLNCDKSTCINKTNYLKNPKLALTILENAYTIANVYQEELSIEHIIKALDLENINMDPANKKELINCLKETEKKYLEIKELNRIRNEKRKEIQTEIELSKVILPTIVPSKYITDTLVYYALEITPNTEATIMPKAKKIIATAYDLALQNNSNYVLIDHFIEAINTHIEITNERNRKILAQELKWLKDVEQEEQSKKAKVELESAKESSQKRKLFGFGRNKGEKYGSNKIPY